MSDPATHSAAEDRRSLLGRALASHPDEVVDVVATSAWSVHSPDDLLEYLQRTVDLVVRVVPGATSAGVTSSLDNRPTTTAHSGPLTLTVDAHQYAIGAGPCLHALATGVVVSADTATSAARWPDFTAAALADGVASSLAVPMAVTDGQIGVLDLYSSDPDGFAAPDLALTLLVAEQVTRSVEDYHRLHTAEERADGLTIAMSRRAVIEQAKGIVMAAHQVDATAAFELLRTESQHTNRKLHDVCTTFVERHSTLDQGTPGRRAGSGRTDA